MAAPNTRTGRAGAASLAGSNIAITKWSSKNNKEQAKSTDSSNFDVTSGQLFTAQQPGEIGMEVTVEGNFDVTTTSAAIIAKFKADPTLAVILAIDRTTNFCSAQFDFSDVTVNVEVPGATMVTWSATLKSNGIITWY